MKHKRAFTLIELMVIIAIIAILAGMGVANFSAAIRKSRDAKRKSDLAQLSEALVMFRADHGSYPCQDVAGSTDCTSGKNVPFHANTPDRTTLNIYYNDTPLTGANSYIRVMPVDESRVSEGTDEQYAYTCLDVGTGTTPRCVDFSVCAKLEEWKTSGSNALNNKGEECPPGGTCEYFCIYSP